MPLWVRRMRRTGGPRGTPWTDVSAQSARIRRGRSRRSISQTGSKAAGTSVMAQTVGDFVVERLHAWGVRLIFGYPGDGINGVFGALNRAGNKIGFVQARHEEMAAFMASAYSK